MCPGSCYSKKTNYPTPKKPGVQNIAACESQVKQYQASDHWTSIKMMLLKIIMGWYKKDKKIDWI